MEAFARLLYVESAPASCVDVCDPSCWHLLRPFSQRARDSNPRDPFGSARFQDGSHKPLGQPSVYRLLLVCDVGNNIHVLLVFCVPSCGLDTVHLCSMNGIARSGCHWPFTHGGVTPQAGPRFRRVVGRSPDWRGRLEHVLTACATTKVHRGSGRIRTCGTG